MLGSAVPDDQQLSPELCAQGFQELHDLRAPHSAVVQAEQEVRARPASDGRDVLPVEVELHDWRAALGRPGADSSGPLRQTRLVDEDVALNGTALRLCPRCPARKSAGSSPHFGGHGAAPRERDDRVVHLKRMQPLTGVPMPQQPVLPEHAKCRRGLSRSIGPASAGIAAHVQRKWRRGRCCANRQQALTIDSSGRRVNGRRGVFARGVTKALRRELELADVCDLHLTAPQLPGN